jgi:predicted dehydrogenase
MLTKPAVTRVGVVGADPTGRGFAARAHIPAILASDRLELVAVCTNHVDSARAAAARWGVERSYSKYSELVEDQDVDLVTVAVRVRAHREIVEAALRAGKAVYCEWPLGLNVGEAESMASLVREYDAVAGVGNQARRSTAIVKTGELLASGRLGKVLSFQLTIALPTFPVYSERWWLAHEEEASGALQVNAAHSLDIVRTLLGEFGSVGGLRVTRVPAGVYADNQQAFRWTAADTVLVAARLVDGAVGAVAVSNTATVATGFRLDVFCTDGQLELTAPTYISFSPVRVRMALRGMTELMPFAQDNETPPAGSDEWAAVNVLHALEGLHEARNGGPSFRPDFQDAVELHRLVAAIAQASDEARWVSL